MHEPLNIAFQFHFRLATRLGLPVFGALRRALAAAGMAVQHQAKEINRAAPGSTDAIRRHGM